MFQTEENTKENSKRTYSVDKEPITSLMEKNMKDNGLTT